MTINSALTLAYNQLTAVAGFDDFWGRFDTAFGTNYDRALVVCQSWNEGLQEPASLFWQGFENLATHQNKVDVLLALTFQSQWLAGDFSQFPASAAVSNGVLGMANRAYGSSNNMRLFLLPLLSKWLPKYTLFLDFPVLVLLFSPLYFAKIPVFMPICLVLLVG